MFKGPNRPDAIRQSDAIFLFLKVNKAMYEGKFQETFIQNDSKYHSASKYVANVNQVRSNLYVKIEKIASYC